MVGHDVWIGYQVIVMPGVRIGNGSIIASGSVVTGHVPDYGIAGGNPATLIGRRHSDQDITRLLALAWWDWSLEHITEHFAPSWPAASTIFRRRHPPEGSARASAWTGPEWTRHAVMRRPFL